MNLNTIFYLIQYIKNVISMYNHIQIINGRFNFIFFNASLKSSVYVTGKGRPYSSAQWSHGACGCHRGKCSLGPGGWPSPMP